MKQCITSEQLKELNFKQVSKLIKLLNTKLIGIPNDEKKWEIKRKGDRCLTEHISLLQEINIGKMIEVLDDRLVNIYVETFEISIYDDFAKEDEIKILGNENICDTLWEAVKYVLGENNA